MAARVHESLVRDVMTTHVVSLDAGASIHEALELMVENRVSALPIVDHNNHCTGILTATDLVDLTRDVDDDVYRLDNVDSTSQRWLFDRLTQAMGQEPVASYMSEEVTSVDEHATLKSAARKMVANQVHHLPVVNSKEELVGILSTMDILGELADTE